MAPPAASVPGSAPLPGRRLFFCRRLQSTVRYCFAQHVVTQSQLRRDLRNASALIQATLHSLSHFARQDLRSAASFARLEKSTRTMGTVSFDPALQGQWFNLECACDVGLAHGAVDLKLTHDHAIGVHVVNRVGEYRHRAAVVDHGALISFVTDIIGDRVDTLVEDRKLHLGHSPILEASAIGGKHDTPPFSAARHRAPILRPARKSVSIALPLASSHKLR